MIPRLTPTGYWRLGWDHAQAYGRPMPPQDAPVHCVNAYWRGYNAQTVGKKRK